jgi:pSer/pThr/pTyr-binding forkhead associated (FHA) protein
MSLGLIVLNGDNKGSRFIVEVNKPCSIGRDSSCTICLQDKLISKKHAVVTAEEGKLTIKDQAATNGTFVNGYKISSKVLDPGADITIGNSVFRVVEMDDDVGGNSIVSLASDKQVINLQAPVPEDILAGSGSGLSKVAECVQGMRAIMVRYTNDIVRDSLKYIFKMIPVTRIAVFNVSAEGAVTQGYTVYRRAGDNPSNMSRTFALKVIKAKKVILIKDAGEMGAGASVVSLGFENVHSIIGLPIMIQGRINAVLLGDNLEKPDILTEDHLRIMQFAGKLIEVLYQRDAIGKLDSIVDFLPVCDMCKRVRDDQGYWNQLESFVSERVAVRLSRGCCPECARKVIRS